jgi:hypothetical protein
LEVFEAVCSRRKKHSSKITMTFADKSDFVPLQAADVLAYEANKRGRDPLSPNRRRSLEALGDGKISIRGFSKPNMDWLVSRLSILHAELEVFGKVVTFFPEEDLTNP